MPKQKVSKETIDDALKIAKGTARPGQSKEQTKIIAQGIEKGIAEFKKREKAKARERDKVRKKTNASAVELLNEHEQQQRPSSTGFMNGLPWLLLVLSWVGFLVYCLV